MNMGSCFPDDEADEFVTIVREGTRGWPSDNGAKAIRAGASEAPPPNAVVKQ